MSADLTPKDCYLLGIKPEELEWYDMESSFPPENTPITHIKSVRVHYKMKDEDKSLWSSRIDQLLAHRPDQKIIVFPVSYTNADYIATHTRFRGRTMTHKRTNAFQTIRQFQHARAPRVLISPAATMGYNFPGDQARVIVIAKVPWPSTQSKVFKARKAEDKEYEHHIIAKQLVQSCGRGTRYPDDYCEVFIMDDTIGWWWKKYAHLTPSWFQERYQGTLEQIPLCPLSRS